jgi:hypothetical protein
MKLMLLGLRLTELNMVDIIVGCPTQNRAWILQEWFDHVIAAVPEDWNLSFLLAVPQWDKQTLDLVRNFKIAEVIITDEPERKDQRNWADTDSYHHMVDLRNSILRSVRVAKPDLYLSLDSDILIALNAIAEMYETMKANDANAVGSLTWLDPIDPACTNLGVFTNYGSRFERVREPGMHPVDVLMGIKLIDNLAYNVNYQWDAYGEDFGWAKAMKRAGAKIFCDGRSPSKHIMSPEWLDRVDKRVGW